MEKLKDILKNYPDATEVSLENCELDSLNEVLDYLTQLHNLKVLRLANNNISRLPSDMSRLKKIEYLDLSENPFEGLSTIMSGLCSLPSLKHLYISLSEEDEDELIVNLANLHSFNGTPLTDIPDDDYPAHSSPSQKSEKEATRSPPKQKEALIAEADLETSKRLFEAMLLFLNQKGSFSNFAADVLENLHTQAKNESDPLKFHNEVSQAKRILYDRCFDEIIGQISKTDKKLASILMIIKNSYSGLLEDNYGMLDQANTEFSKRLRTMQKDLDKADEEIGHLLEAAEGLQQTASDNDSAKRKVMMEWEKERESLSEEIGFLKTELEKHKNRLRQFQLNRQKISTQINTSPTKMLKSVQSPAASKGNNGFLSQVSVNNNAKMMTLRQLKDMIEEIYASKQRFDEKCAESKLPRETMEQHLYTFLNQKYGLKSLILELASSIIQGIKRYGAEDNDVAVFGKILRNEIDEEFRFVQKQLKDTVAELLRVFLRGKYAKKLDSEIQQMHQQRMSGDVNEEEWVDVVKYMYNKEDSVNVIMRVTEAIQSIQAKLNRGNSRSPSKNQQNKIPYRVFLKVLLTYQLRSHEQFLYKFVKIFRQVDTDKNGVVSESEFKLVLQAINPNRSESDFAQWLNFVDPWNNQQITFSECVTFLSAELIKMMGEKQEETVVEEEYNFDVPNDDDINDDEM